MNASEALREYGYTEDDQGVFSPARPSSEYWVKAVGGWRCFTKQPPSHDWGRRDEDADAWEIPYRQEEPTSGLHPMTTPDAFEWIWPEERLLEIYTYTAFNGPWRKLDDGSFVKDE
jgi:hypothetical protein